MYTYIFELTGEKQDGTEFYKTVEYSSYCSKIGEPLQKHLDRWVQDQERYWNLKSYPMKYGMLLPAQTL